MATQSIEQRLKAAIERASKRLSAEAQSKSSGASGAAKPQKSKPGNEAARVNARDFLGHVSGSQTTSGMPKIRSYATGTPYVDEDQIAQIHQGEEVVPADQNPNNPLGKINVSQDDSTLRNIDGSPRPVAETEPAPAQRDLEQEHIDLRRDQVNEQQDQAIANGDLIDQGKSLIAHRQIDSHEARQTPLGTATPDLVPATPAMPTYAGPGKPVPTGKLIPSKQMPTDEYKFHQQDLDKRIEAARDKAVDENTTPAERAQAQTLADQLELRKEELKRPAASSILGKIGRGFETAGNIAGNLVAAPEMSLIPGTDLYKQRQAQGTLGRIGTDVAREKEIAETDKENAPAKPKLLTGDNDTRTDSQGNRQQAYQMPDGSKQWVPEGQAPTMPKQSQGFPVIQLRNQDQSGQPQYTYGNKTPDESKQPATPAAYDDFKAKVKQLGLSSDAAATYSNVPAGLTKPELEKRYADAAALQGMNAKDRENTIRDQERKDAAAEHSREHADKQSEDSETKGRKMVIGTDDKGRDVMVPASEAKSRGLKDVYDAPSDAVNKALSARHFIPLADNTDPGNPGILQMIDQLDKEGKLGTVASRWNDFMAGRIGAGDPDFERLRVAMGLGTTLLMNAHVGSRGGAYMMEHFEDLANAKKMNTKTLRAGVDQELRYITNRAMVPTAASSNAPAPKDVVRTGKLNGKAVFQLKNGKTVDAQGNEVK